MKKTITTILSSLFISAALLVSSVAQSRPTPTPPQKEPAKVKATPKDTPKPTPTPKKKGDS